MDLQDAQGWLIQVLNEVSVQFHKVPGSAIFLRYVQSSYQNDPIRSAVELFLFLFAVRYLLSPKYSTSKDRQVKLTEEARGPLPSGRGTTLTFRRKLTKLSTNGFQNRSWRRRRHLRQLRTRSGQSLSGTTSYAAKIGRHKVI